MPSEAWLPFQEWGIQPLVLGELCVVFLNGYGESQM